MNADLQITLPADFSARQEQLVLKYLTDGRQALTRSEWKLVLTGFDALHQAQLVLESKSATFRQLYEIHVERPFAQIFIDELLKATAVDRAW